MRSLVASRKRASRVDGELMLVLVRCAQLPDWGDDFSELYLRSRISEDRSTHSERP